MGLKKELLLFMVVILFFSVAFTYTNVLGETIWCNPANTGVEDGRTKSTGYNTLWEALSVMAPGDKVIIKNGDWRNSPDMYIEANHKPPDGSPGNYSKVHAETDWEVKLPNIHIETYPAVTQGYLEFRGIVFDNKYIRTGVSHVSYHLHHTKFIRCGFLAHGLTGNNHACGFGNGDTDRSKNQYNLMEECIAWGSGRYVMYSKYGQYNIFRRCVVRHDYNDSPQIFNYRAYACDYHAYQNCISIDSDRIQYYASPRNVESGGFWVGDQYGATGNEIMGCISIKDIQISYYLCSNGTGISKIENSIALDVTVPGSSTLSAFVLKNNTTVNAAFILGINGLAEGFDGFYGKKDGGFNVLNSILKDVADYGVEGATNSYINHFNAGAGTFGTGSTTYDPESNGLKYPVRIESGSPLATAGLNGAVCGPTIIKKIGVSGTLYGETGWNTVTDENLWPFPNEDKIQQLMRYTVDGVSGWYGFCAGPKSLTQYIWGYLGNTPPDIYPPKRWGEVPAADSVGVENDSNIMLHVIDDSTGVDQSSIVMTVEGETVYDGSDPGSYPNAIVSGTPLDYTITYNPPQNFSYGQTVAVTITANDLADPPNIMAFDSYSFTTQPDTWAPYTSGFMPAKNATDAARNTEISFHVLDDETGVDISSVVITVEGETVYDGSIPASYPNTSYTGTNSDYTIIYNPPADFGYSQQVDVTITAYDFAETPNVMPLESYFFTTQPDTIVPYTSGHNPADGATDIASDTQVIIHILDNETGVDLSSIIMTVEGETVYDGSAPASYPNTTVSGSEFDYTVTYNPPVNFGYSQQVDVTISARDLALAPNIMPLDSFSFVTQPDTKTPYAASFNPAKNATNIAIDTEIIVHVLDDETGVDSSTMVMTVEGETIYDGSNPASYPHTIISGSRFDYTVTYNPPLNFNFSQQVDVTITAQDLAVVPNVMAPDSYSFTCQSDTVIPYTSGFYPANGSINVPRDTEIIVHILDDETGVDRFSIVMTVEGETVYDGATPGAYPNATISGSVTDYTITYDPPFDFGYGLQVGVTVAAKDLAIVPNVMPAESFFFTTQRDTIIPYTAEHNPAKSATNVPLNANIVVHIKDDESGVNLTSVKMIVEGYTVFDGIDPGSYPITTVSGSAMDYTISCDSPIEFPYSQKINVTITAQDLAVEPNMMPTDSYFFITQPDTKSPYTAGHNPAKGSSNAPVNTKIAVHIKDDETGVDLTSIIMTVNEDTVYNGLASWNYPNTTLSGDNAMDYTVTYDSPDDFYYRQQIDVTVLAYDLAATPNIMPLKSYSFNIQADSKVPYTSGHNPEKGATEVPTDTKILIHILDDETGVDITSISMSVEDEQVYNGANPDSYPYTTVSGSISDFLITYNPPVDFDYDQEVNVVINAMDLAAEPNVMPFESYSFTIQSPVNVDESDLILPTAYSLNQNYPNPFNPGTTIEYDLKEQGAVSLLVYSLSGQVVKTLVSDILPAGSYKITWAGDDNSGFAASAGIYFYRLKTEAFACTKKMVKLD